LLNEPVDYDRREAAMFCQHGRGSVERQRRQRRVLDDRHAVTVDDLRQGTHPRHRCYLSRGDLRAGLEVQRFSPGRFANYFRELAAIITETGAAPDLDTWADLYGRYDTAFYEGS
jgi:hypothetical protein